MIYTNLESMRLRPKKKRSTSTRMNIIVKANLEMNQDLNISNEVFSLTQSFLPQLFQRISYIMSSGISMLSQSPTMDKKKRL
jgi:hypothetical protein